MLEWEPKRREKTTHKTCICAPNEEQKKGRGCSIELIDCDKTPFVVI
jgi:hypothetical protein